MMPLGIDFYHGRVRAIQEQLDAEDRFDGLLLLDVYNVIYASGFVHIPSERPIGFYVPKSGDPILFVPLLEQENATATWIDDIRTYFEYPGEENAIDFMIRESGAKQLGVDTVSLDSVDAYSVGRIQLTKLVEHMRWIKEPEELRVIEQAARYADYCLEQVRDHAVGIIKGGGTELDILKQCLNVTNEKVKREAGSLFKLRGSAVVGTVHSGPRAALPHGSPIARQPQPGDTLIAGIGVSVGGYHAESGATFVVGEPTGDTMYCLSSAAACNQAAIDALKIGATCAEVNTAALAVLRDAGLGDTIRHRIGHGMGLQGHESPWLAPGDNTEIQVGMVFSNEPGIYRPGKDGYRTINSMIVTDGDAHVPSHFLAENPPEKRVLAL